ncbi:hypothetical protein [Actinoplanes sp. NPDC051411]|uniref:hypothetical protein n=1 Tax=Actinoplanes sp. NPDC051411 TaxID=3155522 RepID=UPI003425ECDC
MPLASGTSEQRTAWRALVSTLETMLRLQQHRAGTLVELAEYLYRRTSGMIGSLSQLVRGAAILAIEDGTEQITRDLLDQIPVGYAAERATPTALRQRATPVKPVEASYSEAVELAALIGSLHWQRLAAGGPSEQRRFAAEVTPRLRESGYRPRVSKDPIAHWIADDSWRPPIPARTTYREQRGFGGQNMPSPHQHSIDRHGRSARWFDRNRLGGRGILYHRHVSSVLAREWSRRMDVFTDTVAASAEATVFDAANANGIEVADYIRPTAAQSDYLDAVVAGVPVGPSSSRAS